MCPLKTVSQLSLGGLLKSDVVQFIVQRMKVGEEDGWDCWLANVRFEPSMDPCLLAMLPLSCSVSYPGYWHQATPWSEGPVHLASQGLRVAAAARLRGKLPAFFLSGAGSSGHRHAYQLFGCTCLGSFGVKSGIKHTFVGPGVTAAT